MDHLFLSPGGEAVKVPGWGNFPVELAAALAGVKPVIHCVVQESEEETLKRLCATFGLQHLIFARQKSPGGSSLIEAMLGRQPRQLKAAADLWGRPRSNPGRQLGYPACCVRAYCDDTWLEAGASVRSGPDLIHRIYGRTKGAGRLPFLLNNVFYLYSRPWHEGDAKRRSGINLKNPGLDMEVMNVLPWHPCSYRCAASLKKARAVWAFIGRRVPALGATLKACLPHPILFWDWHRFAVLEGACSKNACAYSAIRPPYSLLEPELAAQLNAGDHISIIKHGDVEIRRGSRRVGVVAGPAVILAFSAS